MGLVDGLLSLEARSLDYGSYRGCTKNICVGFGNLGEHLGGCRV